MKNSLICFAIILLLLPAFAAANTYELKKAYSDNIVNGIKEIVFVNTTLTLGVEDSLKFQFKVGGTAYLYTLDKVQGSEATFLTPTSQLVKITEGSSKDFDSNSDGILDLNIYVWKVYTTGVTIYATPISKPIIQPEQIQNETPSQLPETSPAEQNATQQPTTSIQNENNQSSTPVNAVTTSKVSVWPFLIIAVIIIIAIGILILSKRKRRPF